MKRRLFFALLAIVASTALPQQRATISGKVVDTEGNAVEYATVGIPSKKIGTLTGRDGVFTLDALRCIGACGIAPAVTINGKVYPKLTVDAVPKIVEEYKAMEANN